MRREAKLPKTENETKTVKAKIKAILDNAGWFHWSPPANGFGKTGISDIHAVWNSVFIVIEAKYGAGKPTPLQVGFLNSIRAEGHFAFVVNEKNLDQLKTFLDDLAFSTREAQQRRNPPPEVGNRMLSCIDALTALIPMTEQPKRSPHVPEKPSLDWLASDWSENDDYE